MSKVEPRSHSCNRAIMHVRPRSSRVWVLMASLLVGAPASLPAYAQSAPRPEQLIKWRQSAYQTIAWSSARLMAALATGSHDEVRAAATTLAAVAGSGLPALFPPGTDKGKGWRETSVAAAAFGDAAKFRRLTDEFARDAAQLATLAAGSDSKAVQEQFFKVAQGCKGCHNQFRQTE